MNNWPRMEIFIKSNEWCPNWRNRRILRYDMLACLQNSFDGDEWVVPTKCTLWYHTILNIDHHANLGTPLLPLQKSPPPPNRRKIAFLNVWRMCVFGEHDEWNLWTSSVCMEVNSKICVYINAEPTKRGRSFGNFLVGFFFGSIISITNSTKDPLIRWVCPTLCVSFLTTFWHCHSLRSDASGRIWQNANHVVVWHSKHSRSISVLQKRASPLCFRSWLGRCKKKYYSFSNINSNKLLILVLHLVVCSTHASFENNLNTHKNHWEGCCGLKSSFISGLFFGHLPWPWRHRFPWILSGYCWVVVF